MRLNLKVAGFVGIFSVLIAGGFAAGTGAALAGGTEPCTSPTKSVSFTVANGLSGDTDIATINVVNNSDNTQTATWPVKDSNYVFCTASGDQTPYGPNPSGDGGTWSITNDQTPDAQFYQSPANWYVDHIVVTFAYFGASTGSASPTPSVTPTATSTPSPNDTASPTSTDSASPTPTETPTPAPSESVTPAASESATPVNTETSAPAPTATEVTSPPAPPCDTPGLRLSASTINYGGAVTAQVRSLAQDAGSGFTLYAYSRPSTTYRAIRSGTFPANGGIVTFSLRPGANTRMYVKQTGCTNQSSSLVVNVRSVLSMAAKRVSTRRYTFSGYDRPAQNGQIVSIYRYSAGQYRLFARTRANRYGNYALTVTFPAKGYNHLYAAVGSTTNVVGSRTGIMTLKVS